MVQIYTKMWTNKFRGMHLDLRNISSYTGGQARLFSTHSTLIDQWNAKNINYLFRDIFSLFQITVTNKF